MRLLFASAVWSECSMLALWERRKTSEPAAGMRPRRECGSQKVRALRYIMSVYDKARPSRVYHVRPPA